MESVSKGWVGLQGAQVSLKLGVGVGVAVSNVDGVVIVGELQIEVECVVEPCIFPLQIVLVVAYLTTIPVPAYVLELRLLLRIDQRPHSRIIETVRFHHIDYTEAVLHILASVGN